MRVRARAIVALGLILAVLPGWAQDGGGPAPRSFPKDGILPKSETGALRLLAEHPEYDGRGVLVAIFDTGVDPGAAGLGRTSTGEVKIVDLIDATGAGDVAMDEVQSIEDGQLTGVTGRTLRVPATWNCPTGEFRLGMKPAYDFYPNDLLPRLREESEEAFDEELGTLRAQVRDELAAAEDEDRRDELQAQLDVLDDARDDFHAPGPVFDCVTFHDGEHWRAAVDTNEDGDFGDEKLLADYSVSHEYATFDDASRLNFSVKIYDEGKVLSLVTVGDEHGTHVAGIVAAYDAERPERNGLAPGARIVSIKIGDTRLGGMETGAALLRGLHAVIEHKCDLINMSFGEPTTTPDQGALTELFNEIVRKHDVIFLSSAGNSGPALSTVGAPGGTASAVIGVGAYVSPAMMAAEYALSGRERDVIYTWASRGPTADGDWGVDILAPGGAISPVPNYSLQPGRQMNGTSMSSPNACGNVALMLSGFKQLEQSYTPISVLRSLQARALRVPSVDDFADGAGLLQVDKAFAHHLQHGERPWQQVELKVTVPSLWDERGIYLREPGEFNRVFEGFVSIEPSFPEAWTAVEKLNFEVPLILSADVPWIELGENLLLAHDGDWLTVRVDPRRLPPGAHAAEIVGRHADHPEAGPLFRVPVTVIRPVEIEDAHWTGRVELTAETLSRTFFAVPTGAQSARLRLRRLGGDASREYSVHAVQLTPGASYEDHEFNDAMRLSPNEEWETTISVLPERTLEVCLAQYWSSPGDSRLQLEIDFHGFETSEDELTLPGDGGVASVRVASRLRHEPIRPSAELTHWDRVLTPDSAEIEQLPPERGTLWDGRRVSRLVLDYQFTQNARGVVEVYCPRLNRLLYDSPVASFRMFLYDANDQLTFAEDVYSEADEYGSEHELMPGDYSLRVELRDLDRTLLEDFEGLPIVIRQELEDSISIPVASSIPEAAAGRGDENDVLPRELAVGQETSLFLHYSNDVELPEGFAAGDALVGSLSLDDEGHSLLTLICHPVPAAATQGEDTNDGESAADVLQAEENFWLDQLAGLTWPQDEISIAYSLKRIESLTPNSRKALMAKLKLLDTDERESRLPEVIAAADAVIAAIDQPRLEQYFGVRHDPRTEEEKDVHKEREAERDDLIDALYRKGRAIGYQELPEVVAEHPIADQAELDRQFEETYQQLAKWVDPSAPDYFLLHIRRDRRADRRGQALERLNEGIDEDWFNPLLREKRRDLYEELGWEFLSDYEQHWMWRELPAGRMVQ